MRPRRGYLLVEALCALALGAVLAAAAATVMGGARLAISRLEARIGAERVSLETLEVASGIVRSSDSLTVLGDTAVEVTLRIGSGVSCGGDSLQLWLAPSRIAVGRPLTSWAQRPDVGDEVALLVLDTLTRTRRWISETIDAVTEAAPVAPCDADRGWTPPGDSTARMHVLTLRAPLGAGPGVPARILRRGRLALYADGRGEWMLGWRRCLVAVCGVVQPIAGPLRTPAAGGLRITGPDAIGIVEVSVQAVGAASPAVARIPRNDAW